MTVSFLLSHRTSISSNAISHLVRRVHRRKGDQGRAGQERFFDPSARPSSSLRVAIEKSRFAIHRWFQNRALRTPILLRYHSSQRTIDMDTLDRTMGVRWVSEASYCSFGAGERDLSFASILNIELVTNKPRRERSLTSTRPLPKQPQKTPSRSPTSATRRSRSLRRDCR